MRDKIKKSVILALYFAVLVVSGYIIFIRENMLTSRIYFYITAISYVMALAVFLFLIIDLKIKSDKTQKIIRISSVVIVAIMVLMLPAANLLSQSLPVWPPRGTIYQMPTFANSIAQTDVGLLMKYYLNGKTLYANKDYPLEESHRGYIYLTDEYEFLQGTYPTLSADSAKEFYNLHEKSYVTTNVRENPKLNIPAFRIHLYVENVNNTDVLYLLLDDEGTWYFMSEQLYEEAVNEQN